MIESIEPKDKTIILPDGSERIYIISKMDAISGREIVSQYPTSGLPKIGEYSLNESLMYKLMRFVSVPMDGTRSLSLSTPDLIRNHVPDWETLAKLEWAMMEYNCSFFANGKVSSFLDELAEKLPKSILSILMPLLEQSSQKSSPPSES